MLPATEPTSYPDVNRLLVLLLESVRGILGDKLVGFYLYGSLSLGDFDPDSSDVDFLFVTRESLSDEMLAMLREMHRELASSGLPYARKLEGSYIPLEALRRYDPENALHPTIGVDWDFGIGKHGSNWILERAIVREQGVIVWGALPKTLIDPITPGDLRMAVCESLSFWQAQLEGAAWLEPRDYQAFAILTMCRALYTLREGKVVSKPDAAAWALQTLDAKWLPLIEKALLWRHEHARDDLTEMLEFLHFAVGRGLEWCEHGNKNGT
ncbi:MAG: aminoglycoside adenylyltransferase domain-containing protein [Chloroflexota bacterium]